MSVLVVASLLLSNFLFAQKFALGIKGGANMGKITGESFKDSYKLGYQIGGFATIPLGETIAIQPEVLFNQTNADTSNRFSDIYDFGNVKNIELKQLLIPVMVNVNLSKLLTLQVGPSLVLPSIRIKVFFKMVQMLSRAAASLQRPVFS